MTYTLFKILGSQIKNITQTTKKDCPKEIIYMNVILDYIEGKLVETTLAYKNKSQLYTKEQ